MKTEVSSKITSASSIAALDRGRRVVARELGGRGRTVDDLAPEGAERRRQRTDDLLVGARCR